MPDPCALDSVSARDSVASLGTRPTSQQLRLAADVPRSRQQPSPGLSALDRHRIPGDPGRGGPGLSPSNSDTHLARSVCQRPVRRPPARPDDGADGHRWRRAPDPSPGGHTDRAVGQPCSRPIARSGAVTEPASSHGGGPTGRCQRPRTTSKNSESVGARPARWWPNVPSRRAKCAHPRTSVVADTRSSCDDLDPGVCRD